MRVLIMGLGLHGGGVGAAKFFIKAGAKVTITDLRTKKELKESIEKLKGSPLKYILGRHEEKDFINNDLIIRNPAIPDDSPYLKIAHEHGTPIDTDIGIFFELCPAPIIGITGTRGKSTTATLIYELLKTKYSDVILAGNIRKSALSELPRLTEISLVVLELSSWQLEGLMPHKKSPHIAVITNIMPDHLNRYKGMKEYIEAKKIIYKYQTKKDFLFLNKKDKIVRKFAKTAKAQTIFYSSQEVKKYQTNLPGEHNLNNIAAAAKTAKILKIEEPNIRKTLKEFRSLEGRIEPIARIKGVEYINDTCATTPDATIAAIDTVTRNWELGTGDSILIAGGADKNLDFNKLAKIIVKNVSALILLRGTATDKLEKAVKSKLLIHNSKFMIQHASSMQKAVKISYNIARRGDIVLLSPACASFGMFKNEFDRGKKFKEAVVSLKKLKA